MLYSTSVSAVVCVLDAKASVGESPLWSPEERALYEGFLWSAHFDGWRLTRDTPDGRVDRVIELPVQRPTSCAFGGSGLDVLYVTSASYRLTDAERARGPLAGGLFAIDAGVRGLPEPRFAG